MTRHPIDALFDRLRTKGHKAFIPFITAGDPNLEATGTLVDAVIEAGADLVEIGIPYSDPIADGAVIQASYTRALRYGIKLEAIFAAVPLWRQKHPQTPLVAMVSYSIVHRRGVAAFMRQAEQAGFTGLILPDLPLEEAVPVVQSAEEHHLKLIQLVTPTTPADRAREIVSLSSGFLYVVSVTGITGERTTLPAELREQLARLRGITSLALCVGFGISKPEHVAMLRDMVDGVIVGSALVRHLEKIAVGNWPQVVQQVTRDASVLRRALGNS